MYLKSQKRTEKPKCPKINEYFDQNLYIKFVKKRKQNDKV